jgi:nucleoside-diphosphate-sugar epimerase
MRILVTGHKGYIGTLLVPMLIAQGYEVMGLDSGLFEQCTFQRSVPEIPWLRADIRDVQSPDLDGSDAIVHLAGLSNDPLGSLNPDLTYEINHRATARLARLAKETGVERFLFSSTCSIYGAAGDAVVSEESQAHPSTAYARSKLLAEQDVATLADSNFSPTFLRSATAYGVSPCLRFDLVLNNLVAWAFTTGRVHLKSDGQAWRPVVHVEDIARAFVAVLRAPRDRVHGQIFNVGRSDENYRIRDLAELVEATVPRSHIEHARDAGADARSYRVDFRKLARTLPEFGPRWNAALGARQLYEACRTSRLSLDDFEGPRYRRVLRIQELLEEGHLDTTMRRRERELG